MLSRSRLAHLRTWLFTVFVALLPIQLGTYWFLDFSFVNGVRIDYLAPALFLTDILCIAILATFWKELWNSLKTNARLYAMGAGLVLINVLMSAEPLLATYWAAKYAQILGLFIISRHAHISSRNIFIALLIGGSLQFVLSLAQVTQGSAMQGIFYYLGERAMTITSPGIAKVSLFGTELLRPYGTFSHPNSLGGFYALVFGFALVQKSTSLWKAALILVSALLVLISFSKLAICACLLVATLYTIFKTSCKMCAIGRFISMLIIAAVFLQTHTDAASLTKRIDLAQGALSSIAEHPLFGTGFGNHLHGAPQSQGLYSYFFLQPVHNIFLLFVMQAGFILAAFVAYCLWRLLKSLPQARLVNLLLPGLVFIVTGMGDHYWLSLQQNMLLWPVVFGVLVGREGGLLKKPKAPSHPIVMVL